MPSPERINHWPRSLSHHPCLIVTDDALPVFRLPLISAVLMTRCCTVPAKKRIMRKKPSRYREHLRPVSKAAASTTAVQQFFQVNLDQLVPPWVSSSIFPGRERLGLVECGFYSRDVFPPPNISVKALMGHKALAPACGLASSFHPLLDPSGRGVAPVL